MRRLVKEKGVALLELTLCVPFLLFLTFSVIDTTRYLNDYARVSQIAYEGARYGASLAELEEGTNLDGDGRWRPMHRKLAERINSLLLRQNIPAVNLNGEMSGSRLKTILVGNDGAGLVKYVIVDLQVAHRSLFASIILGGSVRVRATAPYLFKLD